MKTYRLSRVRVGGIFAVLLFFTLVGVVTLADAVTRALETRAPDILLFVFWPTVTLYI